MSNGPAWAHVRERIFRKEDDYIVLDYSMFTGSPSVVSSKVNAALGQSLNGAPVSPGGWVSGLRGLNAC